MRCIRTAILVTVAVMFTLVASASGAQHAGFYVLDGFGGVHAGGGASVIVPRTAYFGWDVAVDMEVVPNDGSVADGDGILVLDRFGGVHKGGTLVLDPPIGDTPYFGFDAARAIARADTTVVYSAHVTAAGALLSGWSRGVQSVAKLGVGKYSVTFDRAIRPCVAVATIGDRPNVPRPTSFPGYPGEISIYNAISDHALIVTTWQSNGTSGDQPFNVMVHC